MTTTSFFGSEARSPCHPPLRRRAGGAPSGFGQALDVQRAGRAKKKPKPKKTVTKEGKKTPKIDLFKNKQKWNIKQERKTLGKRSPPVVIDSAEGRRTTLGGLRSLRGGPPEQRRVAFPCSKDLQNQKQRFSPPKTWFLSTKDFVGLPSKVLWGGVFLGG